MSKGIIVGLTGQTGSGKSTVALQLKGAGFGVVDGDEISKEITVPGSKILKDLEEHFGKDILNPDGTLNRANLARFAFVSEERTDRLKKITHPYITEEIEKRIDELFKEGKEAVIVDAAALFESEFNKKCDICVSVICPDNVRAERIMRRDGLSEEDAWFRINAQKSESFYREKSDMILRNFPPYNFEKEVMVLVKKIKKILRESK